MTQMKSVYVLLDMNADYAPVGVYDRLTLAKDALASLGEPGVLNHFILNATPRPADDIDLIQEIDDANPTITSWAAL